MRLTPQERFAWFQVLRDLYVKAGGSLEPEPDSQSPFDDPDRRRRAPGPADVRVWLREGRSPELLRVLARSHEGLLEEERRARPPLRLLPDATDAELEAALDEERSGQRERDRAHWQPLRAELEARRQSRRC